MSNIESQTNAIEVILEEIKNKYVSEIENLKRKKQDLENRISKFKKEYGEYNELLNKYKSLLNILPITRVYIDLAGGLLKDTVYYLAKEENRLLPSEIEQIENYLGILEKAKNEKDPIKFLRKVYEAARYAVIVLDREVTEDVDRNMPTQVYIIIWNYIINTSKQIYESLKEVME